MPSARAVADALRRLWLPQLLLVAAMSVVFLIASGPHPAASALAGGAIAAVNAGLLRACARRAARRPPASGEQTLRALYRCAWQRFVAVSLLFALGMGVAGLDPLAVVAGFVAGQLPLLFSGITHAIAN